MNTTSDKCHERPNSLSYPYIDQDTVKNRKSDSFRQEKRKIKCHKKDQRMHSSKVTQDLKPEENAFKCDTISKLTPSIGLRHKNSELNKYVAENFIVTLIKKDDGFEFGFDGGVTGQLEVSGLRTKLWYTVFKVIVILYYVNISRESFMLYI